MWEVLDDTVGEPKAVHHAIIFVTKEQLLIFKDKWTAPLARAVEQTLGWVAALLPQITENPWQVCRSYHRRESWLACLVITHRHPCMCSAIRVTLLTLSFRTHSLFPFFPVHFPSRSIHHLFCTSDLTQLHVRGLLQFTP